MERKDLEEILGGPVAPESIIGKMLVCQENCNAVNDMVVQNRYGLREAEEPRKAEFRVQSMGEARATSTL